MQQTPTRSIWIGRPGTGDPPMIFSAALTFPPSTSVHDAVHGSTTVLRDDDSFGFATLEHNRDFAAFGVQGGRALANSRLPNAPFSIPKLAFGRIDADGSRQWMPLSVEVHHALMDGLHIGRFFEAFEAALLSPQAWLQGTSATE